MTGVGARVIGLINEVYEDSIVRAVGWRLYRWRVDDSGQ